MAVARRVFAVKRVGHGGTLDPLASGLLPVLVGAATKFSDRLHEATKVYDATIRFGTETTTDDRAGTITLEAAAPALDRAAVERALDALRGEIDQVPPQFAALKVEGRPAYARARAGEKVELAARRVQVHRFEVISIEPPDVRALVVCSSGTYVRSLARDLGRALGSAAHLRALRRLAVGAIEVAGAIAPEALRAAGRDRAVARLLPPEQSLLTLDRRYLEQPAATIVGAGESG